MLLTNTGQMGPVRPPMPGGPAPMMGAPGPQGGLPPNFSMPNGNSGPLPGKGGMSPSGGGNPGPMPPQFGGGPTNLPMPRPQPASPPVGGPNPNPIGPQFQGGGSPMTAGFSPNSSFTIPGSAAPPAMSTPTRPTITNQMVMANALRRGPLA